MTLATIATAGLRHRLSRVALASLTLAISLATLVLTASATARIRRALSDFDKPRLMVLSPLDRPFPRARVNQIADRLHVTEGVEWIRYFRANADKPFNFPTWAATSGYIGTFAKTLVDVRPEELEAWTHERRAILATAGVLEHMGWKVGQTVPLRFAFGAVDVHIVGQIHGGLEDAAIAHYEYLDPLSPNRDHVFFASVPSGREQFAANEAEIEQLFANADNPLMALPTRVLNGFFLRATAAVPRMLEWIGLIIGLVALLVHASALTQSVAERRAELATLRIIGFSRASLFGLLCVESVVTCLIGGVLGCVIPYVLWHEHGVRLGPISLSNVTVAPELALGGLVVAVVAGVVTAVAPAVYIFRANLLDSLAKE